MHLYNDNVPLDDGTDSGGDNTSTGEESSGCHADSNTKENIKSLITIRRSIVGIFKTVTLRHS